MNYVSLTNNIVTDRVGNDPYQLFTPQYAATFITAPDEVTYGWELKDGSWVAPPPPDYTAINKQTASNLLSQTDWTSIPSVADPAESTPYLTNQSAFLAWRSEIRAVAVNPPATEWVPPAQPTAVWSS